MTELLIGIPTYKTHFSNLHELTVNCLHSIFNQKTSLPFDVILVDDQSEDWCIKEIEETFPKLEIVRDKLEAVSRSWNVILRKFLSGDYRYIILINNDVTLEPGTVEEVVNHVHNMPDDKVFLSSRGHFVFVLFMLSRQVVNKLGLFDENLSWYEDWDCELRMKHANIRSIDVACFRAIDHGPGRTVGTFTEKLDWMEKRKKPSWFYFAKKWEPEWRKHYTEQFKLDT